jgi:uncharacterized membrane protein HdeD (DUF308 family)
MRAASLPNLRCAEAQNAQTSNFQKTPLAAFVSKKWKNQTMTLDQTQSVRIQRAVLASFRSNSGLYIAEGLLLVALGLIAMLVPPAATLTLELLVGSLLLASGAAGLITTYQLRATAGLWWSLLSALLAIAMGAVLLMAPAQGAVSLTVILIAYFWIEGLASILFAVDQRSELPTWPWLLANGAVDLLLGSMIFAGLPSSAEWAIGLLLGINLVFAGCTLIAMAMQARAGVRLPFLSTSASP